MLLFGFPWICLSSACKDAGKKNKDTDTHMTKTRQSVVAPSHVLWVTSEKPCKGCAQVDNIMERYKLGKEIVLVQDIKNLRQEQVPLPDWLRGTPTLYNLSSRELFEGRASLVELQRVLHSHEQSAPQATSSAAQAPDDVLDAAPTQEAFSTWNEAEDEQESEQAQGDQFEMEVGCDPDSMSDNKVSMQDVEKMMQSRGLEMNKQNCQPDQN